ncbi:MAG: GNAT family N-acetyltransferase [Burkholderiales bacterium]|nr:GNAT family N-acetyltransferase [Burkholderiales bacterium]
MTQADTVARALDREPARVRLRPTMSSDLEFVVSLERDPENLAFITPWERTQHEAAIRFPDFRHFIIEGGPGLEAVGFVILIGCKGQNQSLELKRMVVRDKRRGYGHATLRVLKKVAFDELGAHRLWLDVKQHNTMARNVYEAEGFVVEGVLRESVKTADGFVSMVVMSMLQSEFAARRDKALEMRA